METLAVYQITVEGHLGMSWNHEFSDLDVSFETTGSTRISGVIDQSRLHRLFKAFRDGGVTLLSCSLIHRSKEE